MINIVVVVIVTIILLNNGTPGFWYIQVVPRPVMTSVALHMPVLNADAPSAALEADLLRQNLHLTHLRLQITELVRTCFLRFHMTCFVCCACVGRYLSCMQPAKL